MVIDITTDNKYPMNQNTQIEYPKIEDRETIYVQKITKECVDKLIEKIDRVLKRKYL
ncbi:hypothetical protein [Lysinibacillus contaminans]|uniref:hypothetical protein n=1 Tax=Lysinibacillus contaminans TaxID=1293441 RepID=UPI000ADC0E4A|nr:hypothetical protein [Lysinibacillus contaminans]